MHSRINWDPHDDYMRDERGHAKDCSKLCRILGERVLSVEAAVKEPYLRPPFDNSHKK